ncbi:MAG: DUF4132 domain-containing protein [Gemmataceae bacterium]|nr:DUF4132 domain-containing protein [Gemmataceae bacterium]
MSRREFQLVEGSSSKFWAIDQDGNAFTVAFGRIGTAGQTQTKEFASEAKAKEACEKLIAEKIKKGYVETGAAAAPVATTKPAAVKKGKSSKEPTVPAEPAPGPPPMPGSVAQGVSTAVTHTIDLDPDDWLWATWRPRTARPLPESNEFDWDEFWESLNGLPEDAYWSAISQQHALLESFRLNWLPFASDRDVEKLRKLILKAMSTAKPPKVQTGAYAPAFYVGALIGLHAPIARLLADLPDDLYRQGHHGDYQSPQRLVFGLSGPKQVESELRRLKLPLRMPCHVRACLACTELNALDYIAGCILSVEAGWCDDKHRSAKEVAERLLSAFALVKAPEAAPHMLELKLSSKAPGIARQWLDEQVGNAIAGLIPIAGGRGKLASAALDYLRGKKREGHADLIKSCLKSAPAEAADRVRKEVLEQVEKVHPLLDDKSTPAALKTAFKQAALLKPVKDSGWAQPASLAPLRVKDSRLGDEQVAAVLLALQNSSPDQPHALIAAMKEHAAADSLDAFAWTLFEQWQNEGYPSKQKWGMTAIGLLGGDGCALKLTPLIRVWPGESQHQRAVVGLECLRAIGSDTALMQLNGIAQKLKFQGLKNKAREFMDAIAAAKGLTRSQLEDRIVPDCDLDERGSRVFDFGSRQFRLVLGPQMKPMVKDDGGVVKPDLPKPGAKDDATRAEQAVQEWKLLKKQVAEVAKLQALRLEQAMVTGRRWPLAEFETLLVRHPLLINLVRLLLWAGYSNGKLSATFRVTEDQTFADVKDEAFRLKGIEEVGIVHPLHLTDERHGWGEVFGDYEIIPPFPQLGRTIHTLEKGEEKSSEIARFQGLKVPALALKGALEKLAWTRGSGDDHGVIMEYCKPFPSANVSALVCFEDGIPMGLPDWEDQKITHCFFLPGVYVPESYPHHDKKKKVALGKVDPVVLSEVLADLATVAAKAK